MNSNHGREGFRIDRVSFGDTLAGGLIAIAGLASMALGWKGRP